MRWYEMTTGIDRKRRARLEEQLLTRIEGYQPQ
jgi:hypothetical protein